MRERFEVVQGLGEGAFGVVNEAIDRERGLRVAMKSLKRLGPNARERFKSEFRGLADLTHPNLPLFFELFTAEDDWFFTMEVVDGVPLDTWVRGETSRSEIASAVAPRSLTCDTSDDAVVSTIQARTSRQTHTTFDEERLRSAVAQLREVLGFLHARGYVHRDLKPSNVRVRADGRVMLLDFGLAARIGDFEDHFVGTATYGAPEQARGGAATPAVDAYALGTIIYELVTGEPPFPGSGAQALLDKQVRPAPDIRALCPEVPPDLALLADGWLRRDPDERAPIGALEAALEVFVGRTTELAILREAFASVLAGDTRVVVIEGESGIGKTALIERALDEVRKRAPAAKIFVGRPSPKERVPFNAFDGTLESIAIGESVPRTSVHRAVREVFDARLADTKAPVVFWIDDLQWADDDSNALLLSLLRPPQLRPALFLLSRRPDASALVLPCARQVIALGALDDAASRMLARAMGVKEAEVEAIAKRGAGHPLFVQELTRSRESTNDTALDHVLLERIAGRPEDEQAILRLLSLSQTPLPEARIASAMKRPRGEIAGALERLRRARLVRVSTDARRYRVYHDRVHEVVATTLSAAQRLETHAALLEVLDDGDDDLPARLEHLLGANRPEEAARVALRASEHATSRGAYAQAAALLDEALRTRSLDGDSERDVRTQRISLLEQAHCAHEAAEEAVTLSEQTDSVDEAEAFRMRAARHFLATGDLGRGREVLAGVLSRAGVTMPVSGLATLGELLAGRVSVWLSMRGLAPKAKLTVDRTYVLLRAVADGLAMTDHVRGHLFQNRALRSALASSDLETRAEALVIEALYLGSTAASGRAAAERYITAARALFPDRELPPRAQAWEDVARATFAKHERPSPAVVAKLIAAEQGISRLGGDPWVLASVRLVRGHCLRVLGDLPALRKHAGALVEDAEARHDFFVITTGHLGGGIVWLADDAPLAARQVLSHVRWPDERRTFLLQHWLSAEAEVEISLYEGRGADLLARLGDARSFLRFSLVKRLQSVRICCNYTLGRAIVAAIEAGHGTWADRLELGLVIRWLRREKLGYASARAAMLEAGLHAAEGNLEAARAALELAEREGRAAELLLEPAAAAYLLGETRGEAELRALGVREPARFVRVIAPGFERYTTSIEPGVKR